MWQEVWTREKIKSLRKLLGMTQEQFAQELRVSVESIRVWEQGKGQVSGPATRIMEFLEERVSFLQPS